jgi:hypothetical protein
VLSVECLNAASMHAVTASARAACPPVPPAGFTVHGNSTVSRRECSRHNTQSFSQCQAIADSNIIFGCRMSCIQYCGLYPRLRVQEMRCYAAGGEGSGLNKDEMKREWKCIDRSALITRVKVAPAKKTSSGYRSLLVRMLRTVVHFALQFNRRCRGCLAGERDFRRDRACPLRAIPSMFCAARV